MSLLDELKRRNVFRVGVAYVVASWVVLQVADLVMDAINAPDWVLQAMLFFIVLGFFAAVIVAWAYEITPEGIKRESEVQRDRSITQHTAARLDRLTIGLLVVVVAIVLVERLMLDTQPPPINPNPTAGIEQASDSPVVEPVPDQEAVKVNSVAVLPFVAMSSGKDDEYFADGLTEEILNALAQLPELLITARTSSFSFKGQDIPVTDIAETLGVAHIVEGSVRRSGDRLRVTAQLVRAADGFHLWSENYDSTSADTIQVQEDIAEKIAVAMDVVMDDDKRETMRRVGLRNVEAFVLMQKATELFEMAHEAGVGLKDLHEANEVYRKVLGIVPDYPPAHEAHADLYAHQLGSHAYTIGDVQISDEEIPAAYEQMVGDLTAAFNHARNFEEQNRLEIDLSFVSGNWRGIKPRIQRYIESEECEFPSWAQQIAAPFMNAGEFADRIHTLIECNPLHISNWYYEARSRIWSGQADVALQLLRSAMERSSSVNLQLGMSWALLASGKFEELDHFIQNSVADEHRRLVFSIDRLAAMGEAEQIPALLDQLEEQDFRNGFVDQSILAHVGDREGANRLAAEVDAHIFGPQSLIQAVIWCMCGAPWDIEVTPRFAAAVEAANLNWPPASPIHWPLKDWQ